jgi:hypothetical protein
MGITATNLMLKVKFVNFGGIKIWGKFKAANRPKII